MSAAVLFSYPDGSRRVSVYLEPEGRVVVRVLDPQTGEVRETFEDTIDPRDTQRLITELFDVLPKITPRGDGDLWISLYQDDDRWDYAVTELDLPSRGLDVNRVMRMIADDTMRGFVHRSQRQRGGPRDIRMTPLGFVKWTFYFMIGFFIAVIVGSLGKILASFVGPLAYAASVTFSLFLMEGSFWSVGQKFGEEYRGRFPVWLPAGLAAAGCFAIYWQFLGAFSLFSIFWFLIAPAFAVAGDSFSH